MSTKHIFNSAEGLVLQSLRGAVSLNPSLRLHAPSKSVYIASPDKNTRVAVISGGGAGHEPAHASYTGHGMLTASVSGDIFASPSASHIFTALSLAAFAPDVTDSPRDVLVVINNYTGDRLNFGLAIEKARATFPSIIGIESVVVADDVSLLHGPKESSSLVGPRGLAGNILVCKVLGAYAARGASLEHIKKLGDAVVANLASIGVGLDHCHVPGRPRDDDNKPINETLSQNECEIGLGLHNEPGVRRAELESAEGLTRDMLQMILSSRPADSPFLSGKDEVVLFVNNLGGISQLEMGAILDETLTQLEALGIYPRRVYLSAYMTSLNAPGFSLSLLNISAANQHAEDVNICSLLDDPTDAVAWVGVRSFWPISAQARQLDAEMDLLNQLDLNNGVPRYSLKPEDRDGDVSEWRQLDLSPVIMTRTIRTACAAVIAVSPELTRFDTIAGDGDCGETFATGAQAIVAALDSGSLAINRMSPPDAVGKIGEILETNMGGTVGALFALFFTAWASALKTMPWRAAIVSALDTLGRHTPARPGDRTLVDALHPFCMSLDSGDSIETAVSAAEKGAESTRGMKPRLGRAVYVGIQTGEAVPDPGAWGVSAILKGVREALVGGEIA